MSEPGQSPPPERQTGKQLHDPPGSGKGIDNASHQLELNKESIEVSPGHMPESIESVAAR